MTAAYRIHATSGWPVAVFEANTRVGGRTWTNRTFMNGGQWFEHGAAAVTYQSARATQRHRHAHERAADGSDVRSWINYPSGERNTTSTAGSASTMPHSPPRTHRAQTVRAMPLAVYVHQITTPIIFSSPYDGSRMDRTLRAGRTARIAPGGLPRPGRGASTQRAPRTCRRSRWSPSSAVRSGSLSRVVVRRALGGSGGNDNLSHELAARLPPGSVHLGYALIATRRNALGAVTLTFESDGRAIDVVADRVVIAMPTGAMLRVDFSRAGFDH